VRRAGNHVAPRAPDAGPVARAVREGLLGARKSLPPWLLYDDEGARLYERITRLPEYYLSRAERGIFESHAEAIVAAARGHEHARLYVAELGAGTAKKSQLLLRAVARAQGSVSFLAADISRPAVAIAAERLAQEEPMVRVRSLVGRHEAALREIGVQRGRKLVLFIGSSIGNYDDREARLLLGRIRRSVRPDGVLVLGTDLKKDPRLLVRAYDDRSGVTAAFDKNVLTRINRELGGRFDPDRFRHVAIWNAAASRIEMHLESRTDQLVPIDGLRMKVAFRRGERIHTESSVKYDESMVDALFDASGFARVATFVDARRGFAVHLGRVAGAQNARVRAA